MPLFAITMFGLGAQRSYEQKGATR